MMLHEFSVGRVSSGRVAIFETGLIMDEYLTVTVLQEKRPV